MSAALLLDTNVVIWSLANSARISTPARQAISNPAATVSVSTVSLWEIVLKHQTGKLKFPTSLDEVVDEVMYRSPWPILAVSPQHLVPLCALPMIHKDPFDRLLIAQARYERLTLVTADGNIPKYGVPTLW